MFQNFILLIQKIKSSHSSFLNLFWQLLIRSPLIPVKGFDTTPPSNCNAILQMCQSTIFFIEGVRVEKTFFSSFSAAFCGNQGEHMTNVLFRPIFPGLHSIWKDLFWESHSYIYVPCTMNVDIESDAKKMHSYHQLALW